MSALLLFGDTERNAVLRHEIPVPVIDSLLLVVANGSRYVLTSVVDRDRIAEAIPDAEVLDFFDFGLLELMEDGMERREAVRETVVRVLAQIELDAAAVPSDFPLALAERLRAAGVRLSIDDDAFDVRRRAKTASELGGVRRAQRAAMAGMEAARGLLFSASSGAEGLLVLDGELLLAEDVRAAMRAACEAAGARCPAGVMVSSVFAGFGHDPGHGPLPAGLPIVVDLWPQHEPSSCWGDMTRTFVVGEPRAEAAAELAKMEALVRSAFEETLATLRPGVTGRDLYLRVCERFEAAGYPTQRTKTPADGHDGFQFALGHGVGLEVHEQPYLGLSGRGQLVVGDVVAIEPGLQRDGIGMVRFEDLLLVTESGAENLTDFPYDLG
jgi:Xaa-Pro aminopeptidase